MAARAPLRVFMAIKIGDSPPERVVFELRDDMVPKTAENFRCLCTGERAGKGRQGKPLHYKQNTFHRIISGFICQAGDIIHNNGTSGESLYSSNQNKSGEFEDENFKLKHSTPGVLSMANMGKDTNTSQFFITMAPAPQLDGKHVVLGQVVEGMDVVRRMNETAGTLDGLPRLPVTITDCGMA
ncbi:peptidylprolyl isomerase [Pelomyxa schiedti]|nr:peptidylprolyl isomerase [Pelomyxa schiedti]